MRAIASEGRLDMTASLDRFARRIGFCAASGIDLNAIAFSTAFGRGLDYYTGFMFEIYNPQHLNGAPLIGGGRYDRLLRQLGAAEAIPAVGCSIWLERFAGAHGFTGALT